MSTSNPFSKVITISKFDLVLVHRQENLQFWLVEAVKFVLLVRMIVNCGVDVLVLFLLLLFHHQEVIHDPKHHSLSMSKYKTMQNVFFFSKWSNWSVWLLSLSLSPTPLSSPPTLSSVDPLSLSSKYKTTYYSYWWFSNIFYEIVVDTVILSSLNGKYPRILWEKNHRPSFHGNSKTVERLQLASTLNYMLP